MDAPRPTQGARRAELEEVLLGARRELVRREEAPSGDWIEETARDLTSGAKPGWFFRPEEGGGIAFYARRGPDAYGHVHAGTGAARTDHALRLATAMLDGLPADILAADLGFTGLDGDEELAFARRLAERPGSTVIERWSMERPISPADASPLPPLAPAVRTYPVREVTVDALADLDRRSFEGTADALLVGGGGDGYREVVAAMLDGRLGRFVDEASVALVESDPARLVGAVLTTEQTIRRAVLVDLLVDPERRRRGLGRYELAWTLRALRALGYESVRLWVTASNAPARGLYDAFGFRRIGSAAVYRWDRPGSAAQPHSAR